MGTENNIIDFDTLQRIKIVTEDFRHDKNVVLVMGAIKEELKGDWLSLYDNELKKYMNNLDLYEIKEIMKEFISFYRFALSKKMLYWDIHLNNVGISNGKVYVCDIDSMDTKDYSWIDIKYTLNSILSLFYELYYKESIRSNYDNSLELISDISESPKYLFHDLTLKDVKDIIESSTIDYLEEKRLLLKKAEKIQKV
mgnify:CR=1 FL=1